MDLRLFTLALCLLGAYAVPISKEIVSTCARQCSSDPLNFRYKAGTTYVYNYESLTRLHLNDENGPEVKVTAKADISAIEACDFTLRLRDVRVLGRDVNELEIKTALEEQPLSFAFDDGRIESVCPTADDQRWAVNVKKSILSALQVSLKSLSGKSVLREKDVLGECETTYEVTGLGWKGTTIRKTKDMKTCGNRNKAIAAFFPRGYLSPESAIQSLPIVGNSFSCDMLVNKNIVQSSICQDENSFAPLAWSKAGSSVKSTITVTFDRTTSGSGRRPSSITRQHLLYARAPESQESSERQVMDILRNICSKVTDDIRPEVPALFAELIYALRPLSYATTSRIHQSVKRGELCSSTKLRDIWSDALIMDGSEGSIKLMTELISKKEVTTARANYLLTLLAFGNRPTKGGIRAMLPLLERPDCPRQALLGASAMVHNLCSDDQVDCHSLSEVREMVTVIAKRLGNQCESSDKPQEIIAALKALGNIGATSEVTTKILACAAAGRTKGNAIRVAALEALKETACESSVGSRTMDLFKNANEDAEIRIAAYKIAIECPTRDRIQEIITVLKKETSKQVGAYVTSHLENLQTTSDPHRKEAHELMASERVNSDKFPKDIRKYSRNMELSYLMDKMNLGGVLETDIIYDQSFAPRSVRINATAHAFGNGINLMEVNLRQVGLEEQVERLVGPHGLLNTKDMPQILAEIMEAFQERSNEIRRTRYRRGLPYKQEKLDTLTKHAAIESQDPEGSLQLNIDGKTVLYLDIEDATNEDMKEVFNALKKHLNNVQDIVREDRAFSFMFLDTTHEIPSVNGLPIKLDINGTILVGHKGTNKAMWPSMAAEISCKMGFDAKSSRPGMKWVQTIHAAPAIQTEVEMKNNRPVKVTFSLPKDRVEIFSYRSNVFVVESNNRERALTGNNNRKIEGCTKSFNRFLGIEFCSKVVTPKPFFNAKNPVLPLNGPWELEVTLQKTDRGMKGWEWALEIPSSRDQETRVYRASFNTPNSGLDRELSAQLELTTPRDGASGARLQVKTPVKRIDASCSHKWDASEYTTKAELTLDDHEKYAFELGLNKDTRGNKMEYKPHLRVEMPSQKPIVLGGSVTVDQGRKSQLAFDLHSDQAKNQFMKGSFMKEGSLSLAKDFRLSSDLQGDIGFLNFRVFGMAEKQAKSLSTDMKIDYQRPNSRKHNVKLVGKIQNLSSGIVSKLNSFVEIQMTQNPNGNCHLSWNMMHKPSEHLENEVTIMWKGQMRDPKTKIHVLQVTKITGTMDTKTAGCENVINFEIAPLNINYEMKASGNLERGETPKFRLEGTVNDKTARNQEVKTSFEYQHISRKPLKLSMDALLRIATREMKYSDKLEEVAPNEYRGKTMVQWEADKKATLDYTYRVKSDAKKKHHEFDAELKTPTMQWGTHHQALLRMTADEFELRSKLNHEKNNVWELNSLMSRNGKSQITLDTQRLSSKFETNPYETAKSASFELNGKTFPVNHQSTIQVSPDALSLNSKTLYKARPVMTLNAHHGQGQTSRFNLETTPFDARLDMNLASVPRTASVDIRTKTTPGQHKTTVSVDSGRINIKSKTQLRGQSLANLDCSLNRQAKSHFNLDMPQLTASGEAHIMARNKNAKITIKGKQIKFEHNSELALEPASIRCISSTHRNNEPVYDFDATLHRSARSQAKITTRHIRGNLEVDPFSVSKAAKLEFSDLLHPIEHKTEILVHPRTWTVVSNTERSGKQVALIDGRLDRSRSHLKVDCNAAEGSLEVVPGKTAKLEIRGKQLPLYHKSVLNYDDSQVTLDSRTDKSNRPLATINSKISRAGPSHFRVSCEPIEGSLDYEPTPRVSSLTLALKGKRNGLSHKTILSHEPRESLAIVSTTERSGSPLVRLDSRITRSAMSHFRVNSDPWNVNLETQPMSRTKTLKLEVVGKRHQISHNSQVTFEPQSSLMVASHTKMGNKQVLKVDSQIIKNGKSYFNLRTEPFNGLIEAEPHVSRGQIKIESQGINALLHGDASQRVKTAKIEVTSSRHGLLHSSEVTYEPKRRAALVSTTEQNGRKICVIDSTLNQAGKSHFNLKSAPLNVICEATPSSRVGLLKINHQAFDAHIQADGSRSARTFNWNVLAKRPQISHEANLSWEPRQGLTLISSTKRSGQQLVDIDSAIRMGAQSHLRLNTQPWNMKIEANPIAHQKTLSVALNGQRWTHSSQAMYEPLQTLEVKSVTKKSGSPVFDLDSRFKRDALSHVRVSGSKWNGNMEIQPAAPVKTLKVKIFGNGIDHSSDVQYEPRESFALQSIHKQGGSALFDVNGRLGFRDQSHLRVNTQPWNVRIEANPHPSAKVMKVDIIGNRNQLVHKSDISFVPRSHVVVLSSTKKAGNNLLDINSRFSRIEGSHFRVNTQPLDCNFEINPISRVKTTKLVINHRPSRFEHSSEATYEPRTLTFKSTTHKSGQKICQIDSHLTTSGKRSFVQLNTQPITGFIEAEPQQRRGQIKVTTTGINALLSGDGSRSVKTAKFEVTSSARNLVHKSLAEYEPRSKFTFVSNTQRSGQRLLDVDSLLSATDKSHFRVNSQPWDCHLEVQPNARTKTFKLNLDGKQVNIKHTSTLSIEPRTLNLASLTKRSDRTLLNLESRLTRDGKSHIKTITPLFDAHFEAEPFAAIKSAKVAYNCKRTPLTHVSEIAIEPRKTVTIVSRTEKNGPIAVINSRLSRSQPSNLDWECRNYIGNVKVNPFDTRSLHFEVKSKHTPFAHITKATVEPNWSRATLDSRHTSSGREVTQLESVISRSGRSHINLNSNLLNSKFHVQPFGASKTMKMEVTGNQIPLNHLFDAAIDSSEARLRTNTEWDSRKLMDMDSSYRRNTGVAKISCMTPSFHGKLNVDPTTSTLNVDCKHSRTNRRLLASVAPTQVPKNGFRMELQWDADRNADARLALAAAVNKVGSYRNQKTNVELRAEFGRDYDVSLHTSMARDLIAGPHDVSIDVKGKNIQPSTISLFHELTDGQIKCLAKYIRNGQVKIQLSNNGKFETIPNGAKFNGEIAINSEYKSIDGFKVGISHKHTRRSDALEIESELMGQLEPSQPYTAKASLFKRSTYSGGNLNTRMSLNTPLYDFRSQDLALTTEWDSRTGLKVNGQAKNAQGKGLKLESAIRATGNSGSASFELDSDIRAIPDVKINANGEYSSQKKNFALTTDIDTDRVIEIMGNLRAQSLYNYEGKVSANSAWSVPFEASAKGFKDSSRFNYEVSAKHGSSQLFVVKALGNRQRNGWTGNAAIAGNRAELISLNLDHDVAASGEMQYNAHYKGPGMPLKVTYKLFKNAKEIRPTLAICPMNGRNTCLNLEGVYKNDDSRYYNKIDRMASIVLRGIDSTEYKLDWILTNKMNFLNKLVISADSQQLGYTIDSQKNAIVAQILLPERTIEFRGKNEKINEEIRMTAELLADALRKPNEKLILELSHKDIVSRQTRAIESQIKIAGPALRRPVTASLSLEKRAGGPAVPMNAKLTLDYLQSPNQKLILTAAIDEKADVNNRTLTLTASRPDRQLDAVLKTHLALQDSVHSNGLQWQWVNRRGQRKEGGYIFRLDSDNNEVALDSYSPSHHFVADGQYKTANNRLSMDMNIMANGIKRKAHVQLDNQKQPCAEITFMKDPAVPMAKYQACLSADSDRVLRMSAESFVGNDVSTDASIVFDKRNGRVFRAHLKWDPEVLSKAIVAFYRSIENLNSSNLDLDQISYELRHKSDLISANVLRDVYQPFGDALVMQSDELVNELSRYLAPMGQYLPSGQTISRVWENMKESIARFFDMFTPYGRDITESLHRQALKVTRALRRTCSRDTFCYNMASAYERRGMDGLLMESAKSAQRAHRFVSSVSGEFGKYITDRLPGNWNYQIKDLINSVTNSIHRMMQPLLENEIVSKLTEKAIEYREFALEVIERVFEKVISKCEDISINLLKNEDIRKSVEALREILDEIRRELKSVNLGNTLNLSEDMVQFLTSPKAWMTHSRVLTWDPKNGEIIIELKAPMDVRRLRAIWQPKINLAKYSSLTDRLNSLKSQLWTEWAPPFRAQAMLIGGQHFVTFDRKFYDFAGPECSYLLARDLKDGNFTVAAKYKGVDESGRVRKSLIVSLNQKNIEIDTELQQVKLDGSIMELPLFLGPASVMRKGENIIVDDKRGIIVDCQLQHDICTVAVSGWYFGKTSGLMGTYDYEPANDMRLPRGDLARNAEDLAASWQLEDSCRKQNLARDQEMMKGTQGYDICYKHFVSQESPLRAGFAVADPHEFFKMCLRHMTATVRYQAPEKSVCTVAAAYINLLRHHKLRVNMPSGCLSCPAQNMEYGARRTLTRPYAANKQADVVFVVEEHECNRPLVKEIDGVARLIERELSSAGFRNNRYGVVAFGGPQEDGEAHVHTARGKTLFDVHDVVLATQRMEYRKRVNAKRIVDTFEAVSFAADHPWRAGASKNLILLTCTPCQEEVMRLDYSDVQRLLLSEGITLHIMNDKSIEMKNAQKKGQNIFAVDAKTVFRGKDFSQKKLVGQVDLRSQVVVPKDICVALAQESRGSFFSTQPLFTSESKQWRSLLARRVTDSADPQVCQVCDCITDRDLMHPKTVCRPCKPRSPATFSRY